MINDRLLIEKKLDDGLLPFRLQKKSLLRRLGLPIDGNIQLFNSRDTSVRSALKAKLAASENFLLVVSEPVATIITPLLIVKQGKLIWRDRLGSKTEIDLNQALALIANLPTDSWVEIAELLWGPQTTGGRLIYESAKKQVLEIQQGLVAPSKISDDRGKPTFIGNLVWLEISRTDHQLWQDYIKSLDFKQILPYRTIWQLCRLLQNCHNGLEALRDISPMPAIEFAWLDKSLTIIDVDWPKQWNAKEAYHG